MAFLFNAVRILGLQVFYCLKHINIEAIDLVLRLQFTVNLQAVIIIILSGNNNNNIFFFYLYLNWFFFNSDTQIDAVSLREERPTADYVNLYNGDDSYESLDDDDLFGRELTPLFPALSLARSPSPAPLPAPVIRKRVISRDEDEDMFDTPSAKPKRTRKTKQKK